MSNLILFNFHTLFQLTYVIIIHVVMVAHVCQPLMKLVIHANVFFPIMVANAMVCINIVIVYAVILFSLSQCNSLGIIFCFVLCYHVLLVFLKIISFVGHCFSAKAASTLDLFGFKS